MLGWEREMGGGLCGGARAEVALGVSGRERLGKEICSGLRVSEGRRGRFSIERSMRGGWMDGWLVEEDFVLAHAGWTVYDRYLLTLMKTIGLEVDGRREHFEYSTFYMVTY